MPGPMHRCACIYGVPCRKLAINFEVAANLILSAWLSLDVLVPPCQSQQIASLIIRVRTIPTREGHDTCVFHPLLFPPSNCCLLFMGGSQLSGEQQLAHDICMPKKSNVVIFKRTKPQPLQIPSQQLREQHGGDFGSMTSRHQGSG
jgi:hypothetical protein